ncbi:MAG: trigger factor [Dichotomicrobium sp.]
MQVTEKVSDGLKRELRVTVERPEIQEKVDARLQEMKQRANIKGFRPGKVPVEHLRRLYGRSITTEVLQQTISETSQQALSERNERPAQQPEINLPEDSKDVENVINGEADLEYTMSFEVIPEMELADLRQFSLEKEVAEVAEEDIEKSVQQLLEASASYEPKDGPAEEGDQLKVDFVGKIDGEPFEGGTAEDIAVVIGKNQFIPGFEEGLIGAKPGEERVVETTFPEDYGAEHLAGKTAQFEVTVKEVGAPKLPEADEDFAKTMGFESMDKLRAAIRDKLAGELEQASRTKLKRQLLDKLEEAHDFELPGSLVEQEFNELWQQMTQQMERAGETFEDSDTTEDEAKARNQKLAERRVRLGLVLAEIGQRNNIEVTDDEMKRAMLDQARQYPGHEKEVIEYFQKHPGALMELRGPVFEEKVVDYALAMASITEKTVSTEELFTMPEEEDA